MIKFTLRGAKQLETERVTDNGAFYPVKGVCHFEDDGLEVVAKYNNQKMIGMTQEEYDLLRTEQGVNVEACKSIVNKVMGDGLTEMLTRVDNWEIGDDEETESDDAERQSLEAEKQDSEDDRINP